MQTLEYYTADKTTWGDGPWQSEPDKMQYPDPDTGLPCLIVRNRHGALCGYVGVSESHKYFGVEGWNFDLEVHGDVTFTNRCQPHEDEAHGVCHIAEPGKDHVWWIGFDCSHACDFPPALSSRSSIEFQSMYEGTTYRDIAYVKAQIKSLARQLA